MLKELPFEPKNTGRSRELVHPKSLPISFFSSYNVMKFSRPHNFGCSPTRSGPTILPVLYHYKYSLYVLFSTNHDYFKIFFVRPIWTQFTCTCILFTRCFLRIRSPFIWSSLQTIPTSLVSLRQSLSSSISIERPHRPPRAFCCVGAEWTSRPECHRLRIRVRYRKYLFRPWKREGAPVSDCEKRKDEKIYQ